MDWTMWLLWISTGAIVAGVVGHLRGKMGEGMIAGAFFGPVFGTIIIMLATLKREDASRP